MKVPNTISAGCIVRRKRGNIVYLLLIKERDRRDWVLPKGHVEKGENLEEAAVGETKEETGLKNITLLNKLGITKRMSFEKDEYKTIHWFLAETKETKLSLQVDGVKQLEAKWFNIDDLPKLF